MKPDIKDLFIACLVPSLFCFGAVSCAKAEDEGRNNNASAAAMSSTPSTTDGASAAGITSDLEISASDHKFRKDVDSSYDEMHSAMKKIPHKGNDLKVAKRKTVTSEEREKKARAERTRQADELEARLRAQGLWDTDAGRQSMGMVAFLRGDYAAAVEQFSLALKAAPDANVRTWILSDRANAYLGSGDRENAMKDLEAAMALKAENKGETVADLAFKLGRINDAKREAEAAISFQRAKTPGFVANWAVCHELEKAGKPADGCVTRTISDCAELYGTAAFDTAVCAKYKDEAKYLKKSGYPCPGGDCKTEVNIPPPPAVN